MQCVALRCRARRRIQCKQTLSYCILRLTGTVDDAEFGFYFAVTYVAALDAFSQHRVEICVHTAVVVACLQ